MPAGVQRERTALAWDRTGIAFLVVGLLFLRGTEGVGWWWRIVPIVTVGFGIFLVLQGYRAYASGSARDGGLAGGWLLRAVGFAAVTVSVAAAGLILVRNG